MSSSLPGKALANEGVLVIASTNHPEKLDPAILQRPSRFDRKYLFALPALAGRLTELFLSAMMLWAGTQPGNQAGRRMGELILERASLLREQLRGERKIGAAAAVHNSR